MVFNPIYPLVSAYHEVLVYGRMPDLTSLTGTAILAAGLPSSSTELVRSAHHAQQRAAFATRGLRRLRSLSDLWLLRGALPRLRGLTFLLASLPGSYVGLCLRGVQASAVERGFGGAGRVRRGPGERRGP